MAIASGDFDCTAEFIKGRLFFAILNQRHNDTPYVHYFTVDGSSSFHYESFYEDFGPLNLAILCKFCRKLSQKLKSVPLSKKRIVYYTTTKNRQFQSNAAYLIGSFAILYLNQTASDVFKCFARLQERYSFLPFRDASPGKSTYGLYLDDVLKAVERSKHLQWINFNDFDIAEYEFFEKVENGDLNWIIPNKILAFCGPHLHSKNDDGYPRHCPETYFDYFRQHNVTNIVRLNKKTYNASTFVEAGFKHDDLFFIDGSTPSNTIVLKFIKTVEEADGAVAVHCKAGLGRTGTLIACYMMKTYGFTAPECMAWTRICRPGSVIGPQQQFLIHVQNWCRSLPCPNSSLVCSTRRTSRGSAVEENATDVLRAAHRRGSSQGKDNVVGLSIESIDDDQRQHNTMVASKNAKVLTRLRTPPSHFTDRTKLNDLNQGDSLMKIKGARAILKLTDKRAPSLRTAHVRASKLTCILDRAVLKSSESHDMSEDINVLNGSRNRRRSLRASSEQPARRKRPGETLKTSSKRMSPASDSEKSPTFRRMTSTLHRLSRKDTAIETARLAASFSTYHLRNTTNHRTMIKQDHI